MKNNYLKEGRVYLIQNHAVARNSLFCSQKMQDYFRDNMEKHLAPIAKILSFNLNNHEFQILLKLKARKEFVSYYNNKKNTSKEDLIPESTYIFSRAMSNLQVGLVKKFNYQYGRSGTLMATRFIRRHIQDHREVFSLINQMNSGVQSFKYAWIWADTAMNGMDPLTSKKEPFVNDGRQLNDYKDCISGEKLNLVVVSNRFHISPFPNPVSFHYRHFMNALKKIQT